VDWTSAGENIGEGGPVAATNAAITPMPTGLVRQMLDEKPPADGHRLNILSSVSITSASPSSGAAQASSG
jgi:hypothetical protein